VAGEHGSNPAARLAGDAGAPKRAL
jgi:hypothetical protein